MKCPKWATGSGAGSESRAVGKKDRSLARAPTKFAHYGYGMLRRLRRSSAIPTRSNTKADYEGRKLTEFLRQPGDSIRAIGVFGICIKLCDQNVTDPKQCKAEIEFPAKSGKVTVDLNEGAVCQDFGLQICNWPDAPGRPGRTPPPHLDQQDGQPMRKLIVPLFVLAVAVSAATAFAQNVGTALAYVYDQTGNPIRA